MERRTFLKTSAASIAALAVGGAKIPGIFETEAHAQVLTLDLEITDCVKHMVTDTAETPVTCSFWCYKSAALPLPSVPGPIIFALPGDTINLTVKNSLDEPHTFFIDGVVDSGSIRPGTTRTLSFRAPRPGTYMHYDRFNAPVNRMMGLHGAFIVTRPRTAPPAGHKRTPYQNPTPNVQRLFDDLGTTEHFPGLAWDEADTTSNPTAARYRQWVWVLHQADAVLFEQVVNMPPGRIMRSSTFVRRFRPKFFTISGESGYFIYFNRSITPWQRVGEPGVVRILNAGLWTHSMHIHATHVYEIAKNGVVNPNPFWVDTSMMRPMDRMDWLIPFTRPPDVPNTGGRGLPDTPLPTASGFTWPPSEELNVRFRTLGNRTAAQSPLFYPMHDHIETSQTANGGNYTQGLLGGIVFIGDRTLPGGIVDFQIEARRQR